MFSFKEFCELSTDKQRYSWFYLDRSLLVSLSEEELSLIHIAEIKEPFIVRCFYPPSKFSVVGTENAMVDKSVLLKEFKRAFAKAAGNMDLEEMKKLKIKYKDVL